jgi:poly(3-hydroxybutyrate) depolymerase
MSTPSRDVRPRWERHAVGALVAVAALLGGFAWGLGEVVEEARTYADVHGLAADTTGDEATRAVLLVLVVVLVVAPERSHGGRGASRWCVGVTEGRLDGELAFTSAGPEDADTVVLLHGVGTTGWMWRRLAADLCPDMHVLVVDLPGHGASASRPWRSLADTVDAVADLVRSQAHDGRAHLVGLSLGGYVAVEMAAARAEMAPSATVSGVNVLPFPGPG